MNFGDRKTQISSAAVPPIRTSPSARASRRCATGRAISSAAAQQLSATTSSPTPREALTSTQSPRLDQLRGQRGRLGGVGRRRRPSPSNAVEHRDGQRADGDEHVDPAGLRVAADLAVQLAARPGRVRACRRAPRCGGRRTAVDGEIVESGTHRQRVGVVAVVDDDAPRRVARRAGRAAARAPRRRGRAASRRRPRRRSRHRGARRVHAAVCGAGGGSMRRASPGSALQRDPPPAAEADRPDAGRWASSSGSSGGHDRGAAGHGPRAARPSPRRSSRCDPSSSRCTGPMFVITPTSGSQIAASSAIWPGAAHRHLEHEHLGVRAAPRAARAAARSPC